MYFDPTRQAFVLDKVDSTFNMNLKRMPGSSDAEELSRRFPHLDMEDPVQDSINVKGPAQKSSKPASSAPKAASTQAKRKAEKKAPNNLALPMAAAAAPEPAQAAKPKKKADEDEDDEDEDDDGGLMIEYPEGPPAAKAKQNDFSPAFPTQRRFDDYMNQRESEADDADGESDDEIDMDFKLPSPVNKQNGQAAGEGEVEEDEAAEEEDNAEGGGAAVDLEADLEKEMEIAFEDLANSQEEGHNDESEISEED